MASGEELRWRLRDAARGGAAYLRGQRSVEWYIAQGLTIGERHALELPFELDRSHCWLITIGDDVTFAPDVYVLAHDASSKPATGHTRIAPVRIGSRVFVGARTMILPGVTIGDDVIIGAASVVTQNVASGTVAVGNPARPVGLDRELPREAARAVRAGAPIRAGVDGVGGITERAPGPDGRRARRGRIRRLVAGAQAVDRAGRPADAGPPTLSGDAANAHRSSTSPVWPAWSSSESELERMARELSSVLEHIDRIRELDLTGVEPTASTAAPPDARDRRWRRCGPTSRSPASPRSRRSPPLPEPVDGSFGSPPGTPTPPIARPAEPDRSRRQLEAMRARR